jgi:hypothetical protein
VENEVTDRLARIETKLDTILPHFQEEGTISKLTTMRSEFNLFKNLVKGLWAMSIAIGGIIAAFFGSKH